jgi:isopenicillin N synthase-like dioxygenase
VELALANSYVLVETTLYNAFFIQKEMYEQFFIDEVPDTSIEALHESTMGTSLYQLYDGTLKLWGCKRLLWHRLPIDESRLQMLPKEHRVFPFTPSVDNIVSHFDMSEVVDMRPYCQSVETSDDQVKCALELRKQLQMNGFCLIRGTGIDRVLCQRVLDATNDFLQNADENIRRSCMAVDRARRGYSPMNVENFAALLGEKGPNDLVRKFRVGPLNTSCSKDTVGSSLLQQNIWPSAELWDDASSFQFAVETYYEAACASAQGVVRAICDGLLIDYPDLCSTLQPLLAVPNDPSNQTTSILTLLGYRVGTRHKGKNKGPLVAAHTDVGVITMLLFDGYKTCAQLQRSNSRGGWIDVELPGVVPIDPVFVINVADCLSDLSLQRLPSTLHRVVARPEAPIPRNCCALFVGLDGMSQLTIDNETISYEEWRKRRIDKAQSVFR